MTRTEFTAGDGQEFIKSPFHERGGRGPGVFCSEVTVTRTPFIIGHITIGVIEFVNKARILLKTARLPFRQGTNHFTYDEAANALVFSSFSPTIITPSNGCGWSARTDDQGPITVSRKLIRWSLAAVIDSIGTPNIFPLGQVLRPVCVYDSANVTNTQGTGAFSRITACYDPAEGGVLNQPASAVSGRMMLVNEIDMIPHAASDENFFAIGLASNCVNTRFFSTKHLAGESLDLSAGVPPCCNLA
jgi:hypothetical protein